MARTEQHVTAEQWQKEKEVHALGMQHERDGFPETIFDEPRAASAYLRGRQRYKRYQAKAKEIATIRGCSPEEVIARAIEQQYTRCPTNERPAKGIRGTILKDPFNKGPTFRVYEKSEEYRREQAGLKRDNQPYDENAWSFKDYSIAHYDFDVIIDDESAALYDRLESDEGLLDYTSRAMGRVVSKEGFTEVTYTEDGKSPAAEEGNVSQSQ